MSWGIPDLTLAHLECSPPTTTRWLRFWRKAAIHWVYRQCHKKALMCNHIKSLRKIHNNGIDLGVIIMGKGKIMHCLDQLSLTWVISSESMLLICKEMMTVKIFHHNVNGQHVPATCNIPKWATLALLGLVRSPFLYIGEMLASFQSLGSWLVSRDLWKMMDNMGAITWCNSIRTRRFICLKVLEQLFNTIRNNDNIRNCIRFQRYAGSPSGKKVNELSTHVTRCLGVEF